MSLIVPSGFVRRDVAGVVCILAEDEAEKLILLGVADVESLRKHPQAEQFTGRKAVFSVPIGDGKRMVVRQYVHGGLLRKITGDRFRSPARFIREIEITLKAAEAGVNVPTPVGVVYHKSIGFYRGYYLSLRVPDALDMLEKALRYLGDDEETPRCGEYLSEAMPEIARLMRKLHDAGIYHADLHIKNILEAKSGFYFIDFDAARMVERINPKLRLANLLRFLRSIEKFLGRDIAKKCIERNLLFAGYEEHSPVLGLSAREFVDAYESRVAPHRKRWEKTGGGYGT